MLRYRVAALLLPFFLLAPAMHGQLREFRWAYVAGFVSLCACYVVATCLNDVFDLEIDRINHPDAPERPLVSGAATPRDLIALAITSAAVALGAAIAVGPLCAVVVVLSLLLNVAYSVPPVRLCARPIAAPVMLAFAYVALPYGCGIAAGGGRLTPLDLQAVVGFMVLFAGRMLLKDFRDRRGDAIFDKRTFLLTYGKPATLAVVGACVVAGNLLLIPVLLPDLFLIAAIESYFVAIGWQLMRLRSATTFEDERTAIVLGARMGNAVVLTLLGAALLDGGGADVTTQASFVLVFAAIFWLVLAHGAMHSREAAAAYRG